jgi:pimeloyl-ACP methyl ester carboxylesterase
MSHFETITTSPALTFDTLTAGTTGTPLILLLHGFAESMHCWRAQVTALAAAGYRAIAPSQRGYSPTARPDPSDTAKYHIDRLMDDAMAIAARCGYGEARFHLVGHDWGGSIAWSLADRFPQQLASLTVLSPPHPNASQRIQPRAAAARWRAGAPLAASQGVPGARCRRCGAG